MILRLFSDKQPRRGAVIRQILSNNLTTSTLFWGYYYNILKYRNVYPRLNKNKFDYFIRNALKNNLLKEVKQGQYMLTKAGKNLISQKIVLKKVEYFYEYDVRLWVQVLRLLVQVTSELIHKNKNYYVLTSNLKAQYVVKKWIFKYGKETLLKELPKLLESQLEKHSKQDAWIFCAQLAGNNVYSLTQKQISDLTSKSLSDIKIITVNISLDILESLINSKSNLSKLLEEIKSLNYRINSAKYTLELFEKRFSLEEIAAKRKLKLSTIREHLLDMAILNSDFPFERILRSKRYELSNKYTGDLINWMYQEDINGIKIDFFEFRMYEIERLKIERRFN